MNKDLVQISDIIRQAGCSVSTAISVSVSLPADQVPDTIGADHIFRTEQSP